MNQVRLQPLARSRIEALGDVGRDWIDALPDLLASLQDQWQLSLGRGLPGGSAGYVCEATRADGTPAVLKAVCAVDATDEMTVLRLADGQGYARLLEADADRQVLLLERLGSQLGASAMPPTDMLGVLGDTLTRAWAALPVVSVRPHLTSRRDKAADLAESIARWWTELDRPVSHAAYRRALAYAAELTDPTELVVVHGDPHPHNALRVLPGRPGAESGFCFVDPDGFVGDPAYDLGVAVRDWTTRVGPQDAAEVIRSYCRVLSDRTGVDAERIWAWGFVERMSTGLYVASFGAEEVARPFLRSIDWLVAQR